MVNKVNKTDYRYVNDLRRFAYSQRKLVEQKKFLIFLGIAAVFLVLVAVLVEQYVSLGSEQTFILVAAAIIGGYMALNIGANDVANNMGPAVGGKVISVGTAVAIAAVCETSGALLAGGDVVNTVSKGIISPGNEISINSFRYLMLSALLAAALWINLATYFNSPVSTTHSIVGGILGAGLTVAGFNIVNWDTMAAIAASWVISPVFGGLIAAILLYVIKIKILNVKDKKLAASKWLPILIALMAGAFAAYMALKGFKKIYKASSNEVYIYTLLSILIAYFVSKPFVQNQIKYLENKKDDIYKLFHLPLLLGVGLLCFAHGANDVANAVGPLAAIVSTLTNDGEIAAKVSIPIWVMAIGAVGIALGLLLFGPKLIDTVGQKITRLNAPRAYCVALSSAITVLIATTLGLPVSSTHIAIGAIFGVGFLREYIENPKNNKDQNKSKAKRKLVRRRFLYSIAGAWIITVPASAALAGSIYYLFSVTTF
jgi:PiT family inorganic phosphate transporter